MLNLGTKKEYVFEKNTKRVSLQVTNTNGKPRLHLAVMFLGATATTYAAAAAIERLWCGEGHIHLNLEDLEKIVEDAKSEVAKCLENQSDKP